MAKNLQITSIYARWLELLSAARTVECVGGETQASDSSARVRTLTTHTTIPMTAFPFLQTKGRRYAPGPITAKPSGDPRSVEMPPQMKSLLLAAKFVCRPQSA